MAYQMGGSYPELPEYIFGDDRRNAAAQAPGPSQLADAEWSHIMQSWFIGGEGGSGLSPERKKAISDAERSQTRGLALSGGGIRAAAFATGALQALNKAYVFSRIHYMSTVSGGGYAGTALTWLYNCGGDLSRSYNAAEHFPLNVEEVRYTDKLSVLEYLRFRSSYLEPGIGLNVITLVASVLRSVFLSVLAYFTLLVTLLYALIPALNGDAWYNALSHAISQCLGLSLPPLPYSPATLLLFAALGFVVGGYVLSGLISALPVRRKGFRARRSMEAFLFWPVSLGLAVAVLSLLPSVACWLETEIMPIWLGGLKYWHAVAVFGLAGLGASLLYLFRNGDFSGSQSNPLQSLVISCAALLLLFFMLISANWAGKAISGYLIGAWGMGQLAIFAILVLLCFVFAFLTNLNYVGLHRFYRDRLMETFLPVPARNLNSPNGIADPDRFRLADACRPGQPGPYHLINATIALTSSRNEYYSKRGGDNFVLSPLYCGSDATGWVRTDNWIVPRAKQASAARSRLTPITLASAMAISGAAINPGAGSDGTGPSRNGLLSFVITLLNIRLGYWAPNPKREARRLSQDKASPWRARYTPNFIVPGIPGGLLASTKHENAAWVELTDGGHYDNIGLYELVRRRVRNIIIIDGTADPGLKLVSFAAAYEKVRSDFGVTINIMDYPGNFNDMMPHTARPGSPIKTERELAERGFAVGEIIYPAAAGQPEVKGFVFYVNTVLTERLPANLYSYHAEHKAFPDEPTSDQYFDERQFEAYRELGYQVTWDMLKAVAIYRDLSAAIGLEPTPGQVAWGLKKEDKKDEISSAELAEDCRTHFPKSGPRRRKSYKKAPDRLDWPNPKPGIWPARSKQT